MARPPVAPPPTPQQPPLGPEDIPRLFECLQGALQPATQKQCEAVLLSLEQRPGYISCLLVTARPSRIRPPVNLFRYFAARASTVGSRTRDAFTGCDRVVS